MAFRKGDPGINRLGRPKAERCINNVLRKITDEKVVDDGKEMARLEKILRVVCTCAERGEAWACNYIADRLEGKPIQLIELNELQERPSINLILKKSGKVEKDKTK